VKRVPGLSIQPALRKEEDGAPYAGAVHNLSGLAEIVSDVLIAGERRRSRWLKCRE
jgi:hypothetical protein